MFRMAVLTLLVALLLGTPVRAEDLRAPQGAQIVVGGRILPPPPESRRWIERIKGYPLVEWGLDKMRQESGIDLEQDVFSWLEGRIMAAQIRTGEYSPLSEIARQDDLQGAYYSLQSDLYSVQSALEVYREEEGRYPDSLDQLDSDHLGDYLDLSRIRYSRTATGYRLEGTGPEGSKPIVFDETGQVEGEPPADLPLNVVVAFRVSDPALARRKLDLLREKLGLGEVPAVELHGDWVIAGDTPELIARGQAALAGRTPQNPRLAAVQKQVPPNPDFQIFVDIPDLVGHWRGLELQDESMRTALNSLQGLISATYAGEDRVVTDAFLAMQPPAGHPFAALLEGGRADNRVALARELPWSISYVDVYEVRELVRLVDGVAELHPSLRMALSSMRGRAEAEMGLSIDNDLLPVSTGEAALNIEMVDVLGALVIDGIEAWTGKSQAPAESSAPEGSDGEPEPEVAPEPPPVPEQTQDLLPAEELKMLGRVPFTVAVGLKPGATRTKVLDALDERLGHAPIVTRYRGGDIRQNPDRSLAYTVRGDYVVVAVGPTLRLLKAMVDGMEGEVPSLAELNSFRDFRSGLRGRLLVLRHTKADALYSIAKGLLLSLGAEFRTEADHLGLWRDAYAAVTVEPAGLRFRGALYATDQVP